MELIAHALRLQLSYLSKEALAVAGTILRTLILCLQKAPPRDQGRESGVVGLLLHAAL